MTSTMMASVGRGEARGLASVLPPARCSARARSGPAADELWPRAMTGIIRRQVYVHLRRQAETGRRSDPNDAGREKAEAPKRVGAVHDAVAQCVLGAIGLEVEDDLDTSDDEADRQQEQEEHQGAGGEAGNGIEQRKQRDESQDRTAIAEFLKPGGRKAQRYEGTCGGTDQAEAERTFLDAHGALDIGQARRQAAHAERVDEKAAIDALLRRQFDTESHGRGNSQRKERTLVKSVQSSKQSLGNLVN